MCRFWCETVARTLHVAMVMIIDLVNLRACHVGVDVVVVVLVVCKEFRLRCVLRDLMWVHVAVVWFANPPCVLQAEFCVGSLVRTQAVASHCVVQVPWIQIVITRIRCHSYRC